MAGIGQRDAVAGAHEQLLAEPALEIADLLTDRGRGNTEFGGREREAAGARRYLEGLDRIQRRQSFHQRSIGFSFATLIIFRVERKIFLPSSVVSALEQET